MPYYLSATLYPHVVRYRLVIKVSVIYKLLLGLFIIRDPALIDQRSAT